MTQQITVTDSSGNITTCAVGTTAQQAIASYDSKGAKRMVAVRIGDQVCDVETVLNVDTDLTPVMPDEADGLEVIRHSCAHLMAQAVQALFSGTRLAIGPVIEHGFYYDVDTEVTLKEGDLLRIEKTMRKIVAQRLPIHRQILTRAEAIALFKERNETYKLAIIDALDPNEPVSLYRQGDFIDLCRGPHVPHTGHLKAFKLQSLAGAYWRGDVEQPMLQRIYGTAWADQAALKLHLDRIAEAKKRDHRLLGSKMDLFHVQPEAPGMVFWHPKGWQLYRLMEAHIRQRTTAAGYHEVRTPQLLDVSFWERSGHMAQFSDNMFFVEQTKENQRYAIKPMSCPCHVQIFNQNIRSYRDLPWRISEFGSCHRYEASGTLHGLLRVRNFVQDDGHIFCTPEQIQTEVSHFLDLLRGIYHDFGFTKIIYRLSTRPDQRIGSETIWDRSESALKTALLSQNIPFELCEGEGAFYGPKIEFSLEDCLGRLWQCGTIQVDFSMPERLGAHYIAEDGTKQVPVMLHRAILGTFERFMGILLEETAGLLPLWLAPVQIAVLSVSEKYNDYAQQIGDILKKSDCRIIQDLRSHKIGFKIREHAVSRVPYVLIIGQQERDAGNVSVRTQAGEDLGKMSITAFLDIVKGRLLVTS